MICTFGDITDVIWWRELSLPVRAIIQPNGTLRPVTWGEPGWESSDRGRARSSTTTSSPGCRPRRRARASSSCCARAAICIGEPRPITHAVKFYEKGDRPLEIVTSRQWFIKTMEFRERAARSAAASCSGTRPTCRRALRELGQRPERRLVRQPPAVLRRAVPGLVPGRATTAPSTTTRGCCPTKRGCRSIRPPTCPTATRADQRDQPGGFTGDPDIMDTWATSSLTPQIVGRLGARIRICSRACSRWTCGRRRTTSSAPGCSRRCCAPQLEHDIAAVGATRRSPAGCSIPIARRCRSRRATSSRRWGCSRSTAPTACATGRRAAGPGADTAFDPGQMKVGRRLAIKLLNASKFVLAQAGAARRRHRSRSIAGMLTSLARARRRRDARARGLRLRPRAASAPRRSSGVLRRLPRAGEVAPLRRPRAGGGRRRPTARCCARCRCCCGCSRRICRSSTEEVWSWWQAGSVHRAPWPTAAEVDRRQPLPDRRGATGARCGDRRARRNPARRSRSRSGRSRRASTSPWSAGARPRSASCRTVEADVRTAGWRRAVRVSAGRRSAVDDVDVRARRPAVQESRAHEAACRSSRSTRRLYRELVRRALAEDLGWGDVTTEATVAGGAAGARHHPGEVAVRHRRPRRRGGGVPPARSGGRSFTVHRGDGDAARRATSSPRCAASAASMLTAERTALNLLQRLSGIATLTRRFVDAAGGRIIVLDTRKTTPTLRALEKYAVRAGGGTNHRGGLDDGILIKDNHIRLAGGVAEAVRRMRAARSARCRSRSRRRASSRWTRRSRAGRRHHPARQPLDRRHAGSGAAHRRARQGRDLRRRHARAHSGARRRPAPTTCRSARSRIRRRPPTSASSSSPSPPRRAGERGCLSRCPTTSRRRSPRARDRRGAFGQPVVFQSTTALDQRRRGRRSPKRGAPQGAVALALAQTAGRGRQGREWFSPPGAGLYMSVVVRSPAVAPMLTLAGGVAVAEGIAAPPDCRSRSSGRTTSSSQDAHAPGRRRKLAGILAEGIDRADGLQHVVLGIGINVRPAAYPPELAARVTSLEHELGRAVDAGLVLAEILVALNEQVTALEAGHRPAGPEPLARAGAERDRDERVVERPRGHACAA